LIPSAPPGKRLAGKSTLVTGAGAGIGRSTALLFAAEGAQVAVVDVDGDRAKQTLRLLEEQGGTGCAFATDVSSAAQVAQLMEDVYQQFEGLHVLVNNAGIALRRSFENFTEEEWSKVWSINLQGAILCTQKALPLLTRQPNSKVVNIASIEIARHARKLSAYAASKGALASLSQSLALELAPRGVHVNYVCPGFIRTEMTQAYLNRWLFRKYVERRTPLGRLGEPSDVARVVLFLASSDSDFITGEGIVVDGGLTLQAF